MWPRSCPPEPGCPRPGRGARPTPLTPTPSQLHQLLLELIPGGAKRDLSAAQAKALLAKVRPRDGVGKTRRRVAAELVADLERIHARKKEANKELTDLVKDTGTTLLDLHGIGPTGAARLLVEVGDITRFPNKVHFASWNGTAPLDASSGDQVRQRLSRKGNRQINRVLHTMARVQLRNPTEGRAYYDRKKADGKASMEAMRCVKRRLSDIVFQTMLNDGVRTTGTSTRTGPGGQRGDDSDSSAAGSQPRTGSSDKPLPRPPEPSLGHRSRQLLDTEGCQIRSFAPAPTGGEKTGFDRAELGVNGRARRARTLGRERVSPEGKTPTSTQSGSTPSGVVERLIAGGSGCLSAPAGGGQAHSLGVRRFCGLGACHPAGGDARDTRGDSP